VRLGDADELLAVILASRPRLRPWLGFHESITSPETARQWVEADSARWERREGFHYGVRLRPTGTLIGALAMHTIHWEIPSVALGYWLRTGYDGYGYMTEAVRVGTDYLFESLGVRRVSILCDTRNTRSAAVAERLGFVRDGRLRYETRAHDGVLSDDYLYSLIDTDPRWPPTRG
jgi:RimJ/RimL family protein N-acetyltransferase